MTQDDGRSAKSADLSGTQTTFQPASPRYEALRTGANLRHYVIEEVIGAGGFGITYRATHDRLTSKSFAIKEYFPRQFAARTGTNVLSTATGGDMFRWGIDRFLKEAEALAKCQHPAIVDVVDYFEENGTAYAVLGYLEGMPMGQWLETLGRPPTQDEADRIMGPLLDALEVVHNAGLLHRDIAPDNIMIRSDGTPVLIDFGACREDLRERARKVSAIVKHGYSPPEQYHGDAEKQGPWTDIYAMAATIYRAIAGELPMDSSRRSTLGDGLKPIGEMTETSYRPGFLAAIDQAMRLLPEERPQSVAQWRKMLASDGPVVVAPPPGNAAVSGAPDAETSIIPPSGVGLRGSGTGGGASTAEPTARPVSRTPVLVAFGLLAILVGGAMAYVISRPADTPVNPGGSATTKPARPGGGQVGGAISTPPVVATPPKTIEPDPEQLAADAWARLAGSTDIAAIERFLAAHGTTRVAATARQRLASLRQQQADATAERARQAREAAARSAWDAIADTRDAAVIERFLAQHGTTSLGDTARARLSALALEAAQVREQQERDRLERERREREAAAAAARLRETQWTACREAADTNVVAACTLVIDGSDTADRRAQALQRRGVARRKAGNHADAIADFDRSLVLAPGRADTLNERGIAHLLAGDSAAAMRDYNSAIAADPNHAEALNNRAWTRLQAGDANAALLDANRSIQVDATKAYAYDTRGHIFERLGRNADARRDYQRAIELDPAQQDSRDGLARLQGR